jgi:hypothetical protein
MGATSVTSVTAQSVISNITMCAHQISCRQMIALRQRYARIVLILALLAIASFAVPAIRQSILRAAGWTLVVNERVGSADIIVISGDADGAGELEASDLIHSGVATRVAIFAYTPDEVQSEFIRRGVPFEDSAARSVRRLRALGIENIDQIPGYVTGTENEGPVLARWCDEQRFRSVVVVGTLDHSRRLRRVLHRSMKRHQTSVTVRSARHSAFDPDRWWESRNGIRTELMELEKLLLDIVRHPIS